MSFAKGGNYEKEETINTAMFIADGIGKHRTVDRYCGNNYVI